MEGARSYGFLGMELKEKSDRFRNNNDWRSKEISLEEFYGHIKKIEKMEDIGSER